MDTVFKPCKLPFSISGVMISPLQDKNDPLYLSVHLSRKQDRNKRRECPYRVYGMKKINIYTDGACSGNQNENNIGGWGCILEYGGAQKELHGGELNTTNNRMELSALAAALSALKSRGLRLNIFSDSSYLVNCMKQKWYVKWRKNGWKNSSGKPVENRALWEALIALLDGQDADFYLVKGHLDRQSEEKTKSAYGRFREHNGPSFNYDEFLQIAKMNQRADELANLFISESRAASKYAAENKSAYEKEAEIKINERRTAARPAVIFDLDGTLWDSSVQVAEAWDSAIRRHFPQIQTRITGETMARTMGMTMDEIMEHLFGERSREERDAILKVMSDHEIEYLKEHPGMLFPNERQTLRELAENYELYIASNCQTGYIEAFLESCGFAGLFRGHICYGETMLPKGESIKILMKEHGIEKAVMIGDTDKDQEAAVTAGIPFILADYGFGSAKAPDGVAGSFEELPSAVYAILQKCCAL